MRSLNEVWEGYVFTGVCLSKGVGGVSAPLNAGIHTIPRPEADTPSRHPQQTPLADTPWDQTPPSRHPLGRHPPLGRHHLCTVHAGGQQAGGMPPTLMHSCFET